MEGKLTSNITSIDQLKSEGTVENTNSVHGSKLQSNKLISYVQADASSQ